jgi:hypothetical protein
MRVATPMTWAVALLVAGTGLLSAAGPTPPERARPAAPPPATAAAASPRWEYRVLTGQQVLELGKKDVTAGLNRLGAEGWELAAVRAAAPFGRRGGGDEAAEYYFKRPTSKATASAEPAPGEGELRVFRLKSASANAAARIIDELMNGAGGGARRARVVADQATNQLLVRARPLDQDFIEALLTRIDLPDAGGPGESREATLKVFRLKNASAPAMAKVLNEVMNGSGPVGRVHVTPEPVTNQLIVTARRDDLFTIEKLLQDLDVPADNQPPRKK